jgi:O-acetylhomoserine (thiol)-lyase
MATLPTCHPDTAFLHAGYGPEEQTGCLDFPIFAGTAFEQASAEGLEAVFAGREAGYVYSRIQNPTLARLECALAAVEGGVGAVACASGMAAISTTALALAGAGDEIVAGSSLFGGTYSLFARTLERYGIRTRFVPATDADAYRAAIGERTRLVCVESLGNPRLDVPDLAAIAAAAHGHGVALAVDNTVATPALLRPADLGADLVIHSLSKFLNGHGTAIGGVIVDTGRFDWSKPRYAHLRPFYDRGREFAFLAALRTQIHRDLGACLSPFNAFLVAMGMESLGARMERHCSSAQRAAATLAADPRVAAVRYPGLTSHPDHAVAKRQFGGRYGALLTVRLGTRERCFRFINALRLARNVANLGDARTLVIHPASTFCRDATPAQREAMGVTDDLVRLSVGLEHPDDIMGDLTRSLEGL